MRILERIIHALRFHRRLYLVSGGIVFGFTLLSICLLTGRQLNRTSQLGFQQRLGQFDVTARHAATDLIDQVTAAYATVTDQYQLWWWLSLGGLALITGISTLAIAHHRREETIAYLAIGKHPLNISAQYMLEAALVFIISTLIAIVTLLYFNQAFDHQLVRLNTHLLDHALSTQSPSPNYQASATRLFAHQMTDFSSNNLVINQHYSSLSPRELVGGAQTFEWGLLVVIATQMIAYPYSIWRLQRHFIQPH